MSINKKKIYYINYNTFQTISNEKINSINSRPGPSTEVLSKSLRSPILGQQLSSPNDSISKRHTIRPMAIKPIPIQGKEVSYFIILYIIVSVVEKKLIFYRHLLQLQLQMVLSQKLWNICLDGK